MELTAEKQQSPTRVNRQALAAKAREARAKTAAKSAKSAKAATATATTKAEETKHRYRKAKPTGKQISQDVAYRQDEFLALTGLGKIGLRKALRDGLKFSVVGNKRFITGKAWLEYLEWKQQEAEG